MTCKIYYSLFLFAALAIIGCDKKDNTQPNDHLPNINGNLGYMPNQKGMKLTYTVTEGAGLGNFHTMEVTDVKDSSGYKVAHLQLLFDDNIVVPAYGQYNEEKTTMIGGDMPAVYDQTLEEMKQLYNLSFEHTERPTVMVIPHKNQLNAVVSAPITVAEWHGKGIQDDSSIEQDYVAKHSKAIIDSLDHIKISLGEFDCVRVRYTVTMDNTITVSDGITAPQTITNHFESEVTTWIALGLGGIKTKEVSAAGVNVTELTKIEQ